MYHPIMNWLRKKKYLILSYLIFKSRALSQGNTSYRCRREKLPEERLLAGSSRLPEELVGGEGPVDVAEYHLFIRRLLQQCNNST
jgi:hypothetical protein